MAEIPQGVGWTALLVAAQRAAESRRPDALFHDPLAEALVDRVGEGGLGGTPALHSEDGEPTPTTAMMGDYLPIRTRFFDDALLAATADGIGQVVLLAAGLDGRAFRLPWPAGTRVFEIDTAEVLGFKEELTGDLATTAARTTVAVDLRDDWPAALRRAGFDPSRPTVWLAEGLLIYLPADANDALLARVGELSAPGSRIVTEHSEGDPSAAVHGDGTPPEVRDDPGFRLFTELVDEGPPDDPTPWLSRHGWAPTVHSLAEAAARVDRAVPPIMDAGRGGTALWLVEGTR